MAHVGTGAAYPTHTPLGRIMAEQGRKAKDVAYLTGIHNRTVTEYLAGRKKWIPSHLARMSDLLDVDPEDLLGPADGRNSDETNAGRPAVLEGSR